MSGFWSDPFEKDYILRLIREFACALQRAVYESDSGSPAEEWTENLKKDDTVSMLLEMADRGAINEAENRLFELCDASGRIPMDSALLFYSHLNGFSDEFLEKNGFPREEILRGLKDAAVQYGLSDIAALFLE